MPDNDFYEATIAKLEKYYQRASENSGKQTFYKYLYNYVETIVKDEHLRQAANMLWVTKYFDDHKNDKELQKLLEDLDKNKPDEEKRADVMSRMLKQIARDDVRDTRLYFSWVLLYYVFYMSYGINHDDLTEADFSSVGFKKLYGKDATIEQFREIGSKLKRAFRDFNLDDTPFNHDTFVDCLTIFHIEFMSWLSANVTAINKLTDDTVTDELADYVGVAKIDYKDYMTRVTLPNEKKPLKLRKKYIKHNSGYDYFLNYMFNPKNEGKLITGKAVQALNMKCDGYSDVGDVLRHCGFNKYLKQVFMPKRDSTFFEYRAEVPIKQQQVDDIKRSISKIKQ